MSTNAKNNFDLCWDAKKKKYVKCSQIIRGKGSGGGRGVGPPPPPPPPPPSLCCQPNTCCVDCDDFYVLVECIRQAMHQQPAILDGGGNPLTPTMQQIVDIYFAAVVTPCTYGIRENMLGTYEVYDTATNDAVFECFVAIKPTDLSNTGTQLTLYTWEAMCITLNPINADCVDIGLCFAVRVFGMPGNWIYNWGGGQICQNYDEVDDFGELINCSECVPYVQECTPIISRVTYLRSNGVNPLGGVAQVGVPFKVKVDVYMPPCCGATGWELYPFPIANVVFSPDPIISPSDTFDVTINAAGVYNGFQFTVVPVGGTCDPYSTGHAEPITVI